MPQTAINWAKVQRGLGKRYAGVVDGQAGPKTWIGVVDFAAPAQPDGSDATTLRGRKLATSAIDFGLTTAERVAGFLSNTAHETGDYTRLRENLYYTTAASIRRTWPSRFPTDASAAPFVRNAQALANSVYARPREGNTQPGDGWRYRGGGDFGITFRNGFSAAAAGTGLPLVDHPEIIEAPAAAVLVGLWYWQSVNLGRYFDIGQPKRARALVNAGDPDFTAPIGWDDVSARYDRLMDLFE